MHSAAILAGGRASRFGGRDKGALVVDGRPIRERQIDVLSQVDGLADILIVGGGHTHPSARTIADAVPGVGPLGGIHAALTEAQHTTVFVAAGDMPYLSAAFIAYLVALARDADLVVPRTERGYHPLCGVYTRACLNPIERRLAERQLKVVELMNDVRTRIVTPDEVEQFGNRHRLLTNVNTPDDHASLTGHQL